ncbi:hypothetical protein FKP32DRAFT_392209 [Trametes sanguinea]|nr:hypothetical protein FKP32DRAFT_392209 [Trametes sanguinea]
MVDQLEERLTVSSGSQAQRALVQGFSLVLQIALRGLGHFQPKKSCCIGEAKAIIAENSKQRRWNLKCNPLSLHVLFNRKYAERATPCLAFSAEENGPIPVMLAPAIVASSCVRRLSDVVSQLQAMEQRLTSTDHLTRVLQEPLITTSNL